MIISLLNSAKCDVLVTISSILGVSVSLDVDGQLLLPSLCDTIFILLFDFYGNN